MSADADVAAWRDLPAGKHRIVCPDCARGPADRTMGVTVWDDGSGVAHCFRCNFTANHRPEQAHASQRAGASRIRPVTVPKHDTLSDYARNLWRDCRPLSGVALAYLNARRCRIPPVDGDLRWHDSVKHSPSGYTGPALVARVTDIVTREPMSLHRTWIQADGRKAGIDPPRLLLAGHRKQGGVIRLWSGEAVTSGLGIAEGIETALSLAHAITPVWALIDAGNLAQFPVLPGIEALTIAADDDEAGMSAANTCAQRYAAAGREAILTRGSHGT
jgi:hypothetical protein